LYVPALEAAAAANRDSWHLAPPQSWADLKLGLPLSSHRGLKQAVTTLYLSKGGVRVLPYPYLPFLQHNASEQRAATMASARKFQQALTRLLDFTW